MKSPFIRYLRHVRSALTLATVSLCAIGGCRHLPTWQREYHRDAVAVVCVPPEYDEPLPQVNAEDDRPPVLPSETEEVAEPKTVKRPLRTIPDVDVFVPDPFPQVPADSQLPLATRPSSPNKLLPEFFDDEPIDIPLEKPSRLPDAFEDSPTSEPPKDALETDAPKEQPSESAAPPLAIPPEPNSADEPSAKNTSPSESRPSEATVSDSVENQFEKTTDSKTVNTMLSLDSYCDGIVFDAQGFGYVSHRNRIVRFTPTGQASVWATLNNPKGHRIEPEGTHLVCDTERRAVVRLSFNGKVIGVAAKECDGVPLRAPSDLAVDPRGGFYFTDPGYVQIKTPIGRLHYVDRSGKVSRLAEQIGYPTGIAFDPSRQRLYVAESQLNRILVFQVSQPGQIESQVVFVQMPKSTSVDYHLIGLCLDGAGNLYVTQHQQKSVQVFDSSGRPLSQFSTGSVRPTSAVFGSRESEELILTGEVDGRERQGKVVRLLLGE